MPSLISGYEYDIFISYRQKDNKGNRWVTEFVNALKTELESTFKEDICIYFDENPHDGLLETHDVDASLKEKIKCALFIPIISQTYCDPKSFAWQKELLPFVEFAKSDSFGLDIRLANGNVAKRVLPVRIHEINDNDKRLFEEVMDGVMRPVDFIYIEPGVNRPLQLNDLRTDNRNNTVYKNQINKVANAIKESLQALSTPFLEKPISTKEIMKIQRQEKSIIVLPFVNISNDPNQEWFSDGLTEEIIADLSRLHDLFVISRSSAMTFKNSAKKIVEIANEVNVDFVLEGSVRKSGNNLRITAQLIDAASDIHLWAEKYNGTLDDIFEIQESVSRSIVNALKIKLSAEEENNIKFRKIDDATVYEQYLIARNEAWKCTKESLARSITIIENSINLIGRNEYLLVVMGLAYYQYVNIGINPDPKNLDRADELVDEALHLDPHLSKAHFIKSMIYETRGKLKEAMNAAKEAIKLNPNDSESLMALSFYYGLAGSPESGKQYAEKAIQLDPLNALIYLSDFLIALVEGKLQAALKTAHTMYGLDAENVLIAQLYAHALVMNNKIKEATDVYGKYIIKNPDSIYSNLGKCYILAIHNEIEKASESIGEELIKAADMDHLWAWFLAELYSIIGEKDKAINYLERTTRDVFINYPFFAFHDPLLKNIRGEKKFKKLMEQVKHKWESFEE